LRETRQGECEQAERNEKKVPLHGMASNDSPEFSHTRAQTTKDRGPQRNTLIRSASDKV
jgi:hypothetical protein